MPTPSAPLPTDGASDKRNTLTRQIRAAIFTGEFPPATRLPTRRQLAERFHTTSATIQIVFGRLIDEGFVEPRGRLGTFVADRPPFLDHYGFVFPYREVHDRPWPLFWKALAQQAPDTALAMNRRISICFGNEGTAQDTAQTCNDVLNHRFGGLIFATPPFHTFGTPLLDFPGIPRAFLGDRTHNVTMPALSLHSEQGPAFTHLASRGKNRVAVLISPRMLNLHLIHDMPLFAARFGVTMREYWLQPADPQIPQTARQCVRLLLSGPPADRPNAILIMDDNLVEQATLGILDAGLKAPDDVLVLAHANFPLLPPTHVPVSWFGFDIPKILRGLITLIDQQRLGQTPPPVTKVNVERLQI